MASHSSNVMNKYVEIGREINLAMKRSGRWMLSYQDFVRLWLERIQNESFDNDTERYEALLLALHGYDTSSSSEFMSFLSIPEE